MENASKALIMAGSILIGIILITIGVYVFSTFGGSSKEIQEELNSRSLAEFNNNFIKYQGNKNITIHDIVSLANFARQYNEDMELKYGDKSYISVLLDGENLSTSTKQSIKFLQDNSTNENEIKHYTCKTITYNSSTKRVNKIIFNKK